MTLAQIIMTLAKIIKRLAKIIKATLFSRLNMSAENIIVLDNLAAHHSTLTDQQLPENVEVVFLPPYSPKFNPIENWFSE